MRFSSSESIFTTIGDYPVVDQFDVCYTGLLSGSTTDNYVTGSLLKKYTMNGSSWYSSGNRGVVFSKIATKTINTVPINGETRLSYRLKTKQERSGDVRNLRIFSDSERFYDSMVPSLSDSLNVLGGEVFTLSVEYGPSFGFVSFDKGSSSYFDDPSVDGWIDDFPFAPKFSKVTRTNDIANSIVATKDSSNTGHPYVYNSIKRENVKLYYIIDYNRHFYGDDPFSGQNGLGQTETVFFDWRSSLVPLSSEDISKIFFGFGDLVGKIGGEPIKFAFGSRNLANCRGLYIATIIGSVSPAIRGWKHGLISGQPLYTSAVFRRDRFGQLRDMLEQRYDSAFTNDFRNSPSYSFDEAEGAPITYNPVPKPTIRPSYPVEVKFVKQAVQANKVFTYSPVDPSNTLSSNMSYFSTSSLPYFDGDSRNRPPENDMSNPRNTILNVRADMFGNTSV